MQIDELLDFIKQVLEKRFPNNSEKQKIEYPHLDKKINFACPICGDSTKKAGKKRGNIYLDSESYKCFNDGCFAYMSLSEFIVKMCHDYGISFPDFLMSETTTSTTTKSPHTVNSSNKLINILNAEPSSFISIDQLIDRFSLLRLDEVPIESSAFTYLDNRNITEVPDFFEYVYSDASDDKIYIVNIDRRSNKILGLSIRYIVENESFGSKYNIKTYDDLCKFFPEIKISQELKSDINFLNNYFNILNIDFSKPIRLTEGQFDSMFVYNTIATSGVMKARQILSTLGATSKIQIIFDRDKAGKTEILNMIKLGYSVFLWNKVTFELHKLYQDELDYFEINRIKDINDLYTFMKTKNISLTIKSFNEFLNTMFSDSILDIIYI